MPGEINIMHLSVVPDSHVIPPRMNRPPVQNLGYIPGLSTLSLELSSENNGAAQFAYCPRLTSHTIQLLQLLAFVRNTTLLDDFRQNQSSTSHAARVIRDETFLATHTVNTANSYPLLRGCTASRCNGRSSSKRRIMHDECPRFYCGRST